MGAAWNIRLPRPPRCAWLIVAVAASGWLAANAWAHCTAEESSDELQLRVSLPDEIAADFTRRVRTGVTVRLVHQIQIHRSSPETEPPLLNFGCEVLYDPWEEAFDVSYVPPGAEMRQHQRLPAPHEGALVNLPKVCGFATFVLKPPLGTELDVLTQLDPVSDEQVQTTRRWLAERGIGNASPSILGRAVAALLDFKGGRSAASTCRVAAARAAGKAVVPAPKPTTPAAPKP